MTNPEFDSPEEDALRHLFADFYFDESGRPTDLLWTEYRHGRLTSEELARLQAYVDEHPEVLETLETPEEEIPETWRHRAEEIEREVFGAPAALAIPPRWFPTHAAPVDELVALRYKENADEEELVTIDLEIARATLAELLAEQDGENLFRGTPGAHAAAIFNALARSFHSLTRSVAIPPSEFATMFTRLEELGGHYRDLLSEDPDLKEIRIRLPEDRTIIQEVVSDEIERLKGDYASELGPLTIEIRNQIDRPWKQLVNNLFKSLDRGIRA